MKKLTLPLLSLLLLSFVSYAQNAPVLTDIGNQAIDEDNTLTGLTVAFSDVDATDTHVITVTSNEVNVTVENLSGNTSGSTYDLVPVADWSGTAQITVTVTDNGTGPLSDTETYTLTVNPVNDAPTFTSPAETAATQDAVYTYIITTEDIDGDAINVTAPTHPDWLSFTPGAAGSGTGVLSGTPTNDDVTGDNSVVLTVSDGTASNNQSFTINVGDANDAPTFTSPPETAATQDAVYTYNISTEDIDGDAINVTAPTNPDWLSFTPGAAGSGTGVLSGTPANEDVTGNNSVLLTVSDGTVSTDQSFTIVVSNINDAPTFISIPVTSATQDLVYTYNISAEDIDGDAINVTVPTLPNWLTFTPGTAGSGTGVLTGTPGNDDVGDQNVTIRVNDGTVDVDQVFVISVNNENDPPVFTSSPLTEATQDIPYSYTAVAEDIDGNTLIYTAPTLPLWLDFNVDTQVLSGTPGNAEVGSHNVTIRVFDGTVTVDQSFIIEVADVNDPPAFTSTPITSTSQGALYEYTASAEDIDADDVLTYTAPTLPTWLSFDTETHLLSGTPGNDNVGDHDVTLSVSDGLLSEEQIFVITVANENDVPVFTSIADTVAIQNEVYSYTVVAEDIDVGDVLSYTAPVLPGWLSFDVATHVLTGTPANEDVGVHAVTIRVTDEMATADHSFEITVEDVNDAPTFISIPLTSALQDALYSYNLVAEDIDADILTYTAPVLPAWLSFTAETQILAGTPSNDDVGDHDVTLSVSDGVLSVDQIFVITVANENDGPVFTSIPDTIAAEDVAYSYTPTAIDIDGDVLTFTAPVLPEWLSFNESSQLLGGTPGNDDVGDHNVTIRATDGITAVDQFFIISVSNQNDAPSFTSTPITSISQNALYEYTVSAEDIDSDVLVFSAPVLPGWLSLNTTTHLLSGIPGYGDVGNNNVTLRIFDGELSVDQSFTILVDNVNDAPAFTSAPITSAKQGVAYSYTVTAVDVDGDAISYSAPLLPDWLSFNSSTHSLDATPGIEDLGVHNVTLRVSDGTLSADQSFMINVLYGNSAPTFTSDPATYAQTDVVYAYTITTEDLDGDVLTYSAPVIPEWLTFYPATRLLIGEPDEDDIGSHSITLRISDGIVAAEQRFSITVFKPNDPPTFTSSPATTVLEGVAYTYTAAATDVDGDALTFSAPFLPDWLSFDAGTHILSGTPAYDDAGVYNVTLRVTDGTDSENQDFIITVEENGTVEIVMLRLKDQMHLYPNPTNGMFFLELPGEYEKDLTLEIYDQAGKLFLQQILPAYTKIRESYDLSGEPAGLYFIRVYNDSDQAVGKVILH